jgi:hypothetical protein
MLVTRLKSWGSPSPSSSAVKRTPQDLSVKIRRRSAHLFLAKRDTICKWIRDSLQLQVPSTSLLETGKFLANGVVLCNLVNSIQPNLIPTVIQPNQLKYRGMDNIISFLKASQKLGVPHHLLFEAGDLYNLQFDSSSSPASGQVWKVVKVFYCLWALYCINTKVFSPSNKFDSFEGIDDSEALSIASAVEELERERELNPQMEDFGEPFLSEEDESNLLGVPTPSRQQQTVESSQTKGGVRISYTWVFLCALLFVFWLLLFFGNEMSRKKVFI